MAPPDVRVIEHQCSAGLAEAFQRRTVGLPVDAIAFYGQSAILLRRFPGNSDPRGRQSGYRSIWWGRSANFVIHPHIVEGSPNAPTTEHDYSIAVLVIRQAMRG